MDDVPTTLWKAQRHDEELACLIRLVPHGIEVDLRRNGTVTVTRAFETDREALAWAESKRAARQAEGWMPAPNNDAGERPRA